MSESPSFLRLKNIPWPGSATFYSSIHPPMETWGSFIHLLAVVSNTAVNMDAQVSEFLFSILLGICLGVELVILCLTL